MIVAATAAAASTAATMIATAATAVIAIITAGNDLLRGRYVVDDDRFRRTISSAVISVLVLGLRCRHLRLRLRALDLALAAVPVSTTAMVAASAVIAVGERFQRASAEQQPCHGEHSDDG